MNARSVKESDCPRMKVEKSSANREKPESRRGRTVRQSEGGNGEKNKETQMVSLRNIRET